MKNINVGVENLSPYDSGERIGPRVDYNTRMVSHFEKVERHFRIRRKRSIQISKNHSFDYFIRVNKILNWLKAVRISLH